MKFPKFRKIFSDYDNSVSMLNVMIFNVQKIDLHSIKLKSITKTEKYQPANMSGKKEMKIKGDKMTKQEGVDKLKEFGNKSSYATKAQVERALKDNKVKVIRK